MSFEPGVVSLIVFGIMIVLWCLDRLPMAFISMAGCVVCVVLGICSLPQAMSGFTNDLVFLVAGMEIVGIALFKVGLANVVGGVVLKASKNNEKRLMIVSYFIAAVMSAFLSNMTVVVFFLVIFKSVVNSSTHYNIKHITIPMIAGAVTGGVCTLIGSTPQLAGQSVIENNQGLGMQLFEMFDFTPIGIIVVAITGLALYVFAYGHGKKVLSRMSVKSKGPIVAHALEQSPSQTPTQNSGRQAQVANMGQEQAHGLGLKQTQGEGPALTQAANQAHAQRSGLDKMQGKSLAQIGESAGGASASAMHEGKKDGCNQFGSVPNKKKLYIMAGITVLMLVFMITEFVTVGTAAMIAALLAIVTGCVTQKQAFSEMNWNIVVWLGGCFGIAEILKISGGNDIMANTLASIVPTGVSPFLFFAVVTLICMVLTQLISNTACVLIFMPIFLPMATTMGISPYPIALGVIFGSSLAFATPLASAQIGLALTIGHSFKEIVRYGLLLHVVMYLTVIVTIPIFFPL